MEKLSRILISSALPCVFGALLASTASSQGADECANATVIAGSGQFPISNVGATSSGPVSSCGAGPSSDVWLSWTSGSGTDYCFSICTTDFDAVFTLYDGCGGTELACEDAVGCTPSLFDLELMVLGLAPNTAYTIRIDGWQGMQGNATLEIGEVLPPGNDACASATPISGTGAFAFDTSAAATDGATDPTCLVFGSGQVESDIWYSWTAPASGLFSLGTCSGAAFDTRIAVYDAQACPPANALACDDDACFFQSRLEFAAVLGQSYLIRVGGYVPTDKGTGSFEILPVVRPTNDDCANAQAILGSGPFAFDNRMATTDGGAEPLCPAGGPPEADVWFAWVAPTTGRYAASTCGGTTLDTRVVVYTGPTCGLGTALACGDNECGTQTSAAFDAVQGQSYLVRIGSTGTVYRFDGTFTIDLAPPPPGDDCASAVPLVGTGSFPFDNRGATTDGLPDAACAEFSSPEVHDDLWFRWTAPGNTRYQVETCGFTAFDTKLAVYADQVCPPTGPLACSDDVCSLQSRVTFVATGGASYLIRVGSFMAGTQGQGELSITPIGTPSPAFCDATDGALATCPCANPGASDTGCDIVQGTGGVSLLIFGQDTTLSRATLRGAGFPRTSSPAAILIRATALDPSAPLVFGDGLLCVGVPVVRLAATLAGAGSSTHTFMHGAMAGPGTFYYQLWFRNTPSMVCTPDAFNVSNGRSLTW
jgi:hypothetical protein